MKCSMCGRLMEPTLALAFFYPQLRRVDADVLPWACRHCRLLASEPYVPGVAS